MLRAPLAALLLVALALAGCTGLDDGSFNLSATAFQHDDTTATFTLDVEGATAVTTDHIGGHYWLGPVDDPTAAFDERAGDCVHVAGGGELPGSFPITCELGHVGVLSLFGHARVTEDDETFNYWTAPQTVTVTPEDDTFTLEITDLETVEGGVSFMLAIAGDLKAFSDHIGGHIWATSTDEPTAAGSDGACSHVVGTAPGSFAVTCTFDGDAPWTYRGHLRVTVGEEMWNYWTAEQTFLG